MTTTLGEIDSVLVLDVFVLLLIGMGPKVALVPFLDVTAEMDDETRREVAERMIRTAVVVALVLVVFGSLLMRLLHFSRDSLFIAGGVVFFLLALRMIVSGQREEDHEETTSDRDPMETALYPLAVPYLLNPVGITLLVTFSGALDSLVMLAVLVVLVLLVGAFDWLVFTNVDRVAANLDESRLAVTETVFGVLLAALAVEFILDGLAGLDIIPHGVL
ncbi:MULTISPECIES: MarC family protein [Salinibaculum]|uniref:MarC family protein n=1 Tax=Salinibaculum TaxID=2732368 RepID=UPI0030D21455